mgnify:CR=1 FL=1
MPAPTPLNPHHYRRDGETYALAPGTYDPDDEASVIAAIEAIRAQIAAGPPVSPPEPPSGAARQQRQLKKLLKTDPTEALLLTTGLKK